MAYDDEAGPNISVTPSGARTTRRSTPARDSARRDTSEYDPGRARTGGASP